VPVARSDGVSEKDPPFVSLFAIVADPQRFHGREVITAGFVGFDRGLADIGVNSESLKFGLFLNRVYVDYTGCENRDTFEREAGGRCCWLRGVVDAEDKGPESPVDYACTLRLRRLTIVNRSSVN
jgi:hypothetical protein